MWTRDKYITPGSFFLVNLSFFNTGISSLEDMADEEKIHLNFFIFLPFFTIFIRSGEAESCFRQLTEPYQVARRKHSEGWIRSVCNAL